jgi:hypothetical protein
MTDTHAPKSVSSVILRFLFSEDYEANRLGFSKDRWRKAGVKKLIRRSV